MNAQAVAVLASWGRVFAAAILTYLLTGLASGADLDPVAILVAGLIAVLPVIINWLSPADPRYGVGYLPADDAEYDPELDESLADPEPELEV